jgi:hypothetical protein
VPPSGSRLSWWRRTHRRKAAKLEDEACAIRMDMDTTQVRDNHVCLLQLVRRMSCRESHDTGACRAARSHAWRGILEHHARRWFATEALRSEPVAVWCGLSECDVLAGHEHAWDGNPRGVQAPLGERTPSRRDHCPGAGRQGRQESQRSVDGHEAIDIRELGGIEPGHL